MNYDYYSHVGEMHLAELRQEAEQDCLIQAAQGDTPKLYHHWATLLGQAMIQSGTQLMHFGQAGPHTLKLEPTFPERKN